MLSSIHNIYIVCIRIDVQMLSTILLVCIVAVFFNFSAADWRQLSERRSRDKVQPGIQFVSSPTGINSKSSIYFLSRGDFHSSQYGHTGTVGKTDFDVYTTRSFRTMLILLHAVIPSSLPLSCYK